MPANRQSWMVVAIDGQAASGKGTISKRVCEEFQFKYLDTGKLYRSLTYYLIKGNRKKLFERDKEEFHRYLETRKPSDTELASEFISRHTPQVASQPWARQFLLDIQKSFAEPDESFCGVVLDGRDIGTVVCPDADVKIFVQADIETRARRRTQQMIESGEIASFEKVLEDLRSRDTSDRERAVSPLKPAEDALIVDTTDISIDEAVGRIVSRISEVRQIAECP